MRIILTILLATLLGGGGVYLWLYFGGFEAEQGKAIAFIDAYGNYAEIADTVEALTHLPGTEGNADRAELMTLLESVLTEGMEPERRDTLARLAFANLDNLKKEVDAAQASQAKLYQLLQDLDNASLVFRGVDLRTRTEAIVELARKRAELSARVTSILSETNEQTYTIITRILADKGELTQEHITEINNATAEAEKRFATLTDLYAELSAKKAELDIAFTAFASTAI